MQEPGSERRLAAILAVDMAGYSRRAETDQAGAVQAVTALSQVVHAAAADHGGRVFNTAGDGFMLEFPTASGALEAAADLAAKAPAPVRIGAHLGDVHVTPGGDLLGHGVNVAARLQAMAEPGAILVSDDVRRAARGPLADQLKPQGAARLDKMRETSRIYALRLPGLTIGKAVRRSRAPLVWGGAGAAVVAAIGLAGLWVAHSSQAGSPELKTAVRDFTIESASAPPQFGAAIADSIAAGLGERQAPTVSRDLVKGGDTQGARLLVGGEISRGGANLRIHAHVDDARAGVILWAADFERPAAQTEALEDTAVTKIADLIDRVRRDAATHTAALTPDSLAALMQAEDISRQALNDGNAQKIAAWRRVTALAPHFSRGHAGLAFYDVTDLYFSRPPPPVLAQRRAEARAEIAAALALDPHDGYAYQAGSQLPSGWDFAAQEDWLDKGLAVDPDNSGLNYAEADLAGAVGRLAEALMLHRKGLDGDPLSRSKTEAVVFAEIGVGQFAEARMLNDRVRRMYADYNTAQTAELTLDLIYGDRASGAAALAAAERGELGLTATDIAAWRQYLAARAGQTPAATAARAIAQAALENRQLDLGLEVGALAKLGQVDMAFAELERRMPMHLKFFFSTLYQPAEGDLRRSPNFMPFVAQYGVPQYWLKTGRWPDYCAEPKLPYNCEAAAKAAAAVAKPLY